MNNYHNPYRNPYPGQGNTRFTNSHGASQSPEQDAAPQPETTKQNQAEDQNPGKTANPSARQTETAQEMHSQSAPPPGSNRGTAGWQNDPSLKNMDLKKLAFLSELVAESGNKPLDALLPFLISANQNANSMGLQFNDAETGLLLEVLKKYMSPEEQSRIDMLRKMADMLGKKQ